MFIRVVQRNHIYINGNRALELHRQGDRDLFCYDDIIVKIDEYKGSQQGLCEYRLWNKLTEYEKKFFVPIIDFGWFMEKGNKTYWIAQPFVEFQYADMFIYEHNDYRKLRDIETKYMLSDVSANTNNFGYNKNGEIIVWDYGI